MNHSPLLYDPALNRTQEYQLNHILLLTLILVIMKNMLLTILLVLFTIALKGQIVAVVDYMKVPVSKQDAYLATEKQWKTLHQNRVDAGSILGWELYYVRNSGTQSPYNFATVTIYENFAKTEAPFSDADFKKAFGNNAAEVLNKTTASRDLIYSETYQLAVGLPREGSDKYIVVNSFHTDDLGKYLNMEKVGFMPLQAESMKMGHRSSWGIWTRWPNGDNSIQAVAVDGYTNFADINSMDYNAVIEKVIAGKKPAETIEMLDQIYKTDEMRKVVKSEIWEVVDETTPKK